MKYKILFASLLIGSSVSGFSQGTLEDYNRAYSLGKKLNYGRVENANIEPHWIDGTNYLWYTTEKEGIRT